MYPQIIERICIKTSTLHNSTSLNTTTTNPTKKMNKIKKKNTNTRKKKIKENEEKITKLKEYSKGIPNRVSKKKKK